LSGLINRFAWCELTIERIMSRTFKDAPYWVRANREETHVYYRHSHFLIGKKYKKLRYVTDENGDYVVEKKIERVHTFEEYPNHYYNDEGEITLTTYRYRIRGFKDVTKYVYATEPYVYKEYEDHCTCGVSVNTRDGVNANGKLNPCTRELTYVKQRPWYSEVIYDESNAGKHKSRQDLKQVAKRFNTEQWLDEEDVPVQLDQVKRAQIWIH
jgi:hypothetical protein